MKTKNIITNSLFAVWFIIGFVHKLWWKNEIFNYIGMTCGLLVWWLWCYGFKSEYKWLVVLNYTWLALINIGFIMLTYDMITGQL